MAAYDIVEEVRNRRNLDSDNKVARLVNVERQIISGYKNQGKKPSAEILLDLMIAGELSAEETKELLIRNKSSGFARLSLLIVTSFFMSLILFTNIASSTTLYTLCEMKGRLKRCTRHALSWLEFKPLIT